MTQAELVPDAIARALGMTPRAGSDTEQLAALLAGRELLLILDNLEQVIESAPFIARLDAACPHLTMLVTSRVRLRLSSEREMAVPRSRWPIPGLPSTSSAQAMRSSSLPNGPGASTRDSSCRIKMSRPSQKFAAGWMGSRWQSSWRHRACACCHQGLCSIGWIAACRS